MNTQYNLWLLTEGVISTSFSVIILFLITFITRLPWITHLGSDFYTQYWWQQQFRLSKKWIKPIYVDSIITEASTFYPPFPASFFARLPEKWVVPIGLLANFAFDAICAVCLYALMQFQDFDPLTSFLSAILWVCLPILHPVNARLIGLGGRTLGPLLFSLWMIGAYSAVNGHWIIGAGVMLLTTLLIALSSQMALQCLLLHSLIISVAYQNLIIILISFIGLIIIFNTNLRDLFLLKLVHIRWYYAYGIRLLKNRNSFHALIILANKNPAQAICYVLSSTLPGIIIVGFVGLVPLTPFIFKSLGEFNKSPLLFFCFVAAAGGVIGSILTLKGPLEVFGESERYLEYVSPFFVIAAVILYDGGRLNEILLLCIILSLFGVFVNLILSRLDRLSEMMGAINYSGEIDCIRKILEPLGSRHIATSPISMASKLSVELNRSSQFKFLHVLLLDKKTGQHPWPTSAGAYPYLDTRPEFLDFYGIDTVIVDRAHLRYLPEATNTLQLLGWKQWSSPMYEIFTR
jgi:hypothetical protein